MKRPVFVIALMGAVLGTTQGSADPVADFYRGKRIEPMTGAELETLVRKLITAPDDLKGNVTAAIKPANVQTLPKGGAKK